MEQAGRKTVVYLLRSLNIGGAERYVVETAKALDRTRFLPKIYCIAGGGPLSHEAEEHGIEVSAWEAVPGLPRVLGFGSKFFALCRYLRQEQPDIVHCYMYTPSIYGGIAARLTGSAVVFTNRMRLGAFKEDHLLFQPLENFVNRLVDKVLVNSEALKHDVLQRERIAPEKLHVVYGGVDVRKFAPANDSQEFRRSVARKKHQLGIPETAPVVAIIANLAHYKGYFEFIEAASRVHLRHPDVRFLCIGKDRGIQPQLEEIREAPRSGRARDFYRTTSTY